MATATVTAVAAATDESERGPRQGEPLPTAKGLTSEVEGLTSEQKGSAPGRALSTHYISSITSTEKDINSKERSADVTAGVLIRLIDAAATLGELDNLYQDHGHLGHLWDKPWVKEALDAKLRSLGLSPELARR